MPEAAQLDQAETIAFLSSGRAFPGDAEVEIRETHGALIFLSEDTALKLKRAVRYDYMDLSTVDLRRRMIERELELNRPAAPEIYRDVVAVVRTPDGLALGGDGPVVDWVLRMWRFPADGELQFIAERGDFDDRLATATGAAIAAYHAAAPVRDLAGRALIGDILDELRRVFTEFRGAAGTTGVAAWQEATVRQFERVAPLLDARGRSGHVRRAHGDLHLRNIVLIDDRPVPFDALEFDETLGTCDLLYDIAFLVMDLCHRGLDRQACRVLDAWLREARGAEDAGLAALPLFLSIRAAIRAMVSLQTDAVRRRPARSTSETAAYLDLAQAALTPAPACLVAVGGFSGSGKSVLARALAPGLGAMPGAVMLASDLERKAGRDPARPLDPAQYGATQRDTVYRGMLSRAQTILSAGHCALLDATFLAPGLRSAASDVARHAGVPFVGLWLDAPRAVLAARVAGRAGDASDADRDVLDRQMAAGCGAMDWRRIDASGDPDATLSAARGALGPVIRRHRPPARRN